MDANETRFHLLLGRGDWARSKTESGLPIFEESGAQAAAFSWDARRGEVTLGARFSLQTGAVADRTPSLEDRRGAGQDRFGNWYWIAKSKREILVNSAGDSATTHFWASTDEAPGACAGGAFQEIAPAAAAALEFSGLAVTEQHYLAVGVLEPAGILVFDLFHGGPPRRFTWPGAVPFAPFDMAPAPGGGLWILDRANRRLWAMDRTFAVIRAGQMDAALPQPAEAFSPADGSRPPLRPPRKFPLGVSLGLSSPLGAFDPIGLAALPDGGVLVLESGPGARFAKIHRFGLGGELGAPVSTEAALAILAPENRPNFQLPGFDIAFIASEQTPAGQRANVLYVADANGIQAWAFTLDSSGAQLSLDPFPEYYPMRMFAGLGLTAGQRQVYYSLPDRWIPLTAQRRPRFAGSGAIFTKVFDGKQPDCVWHRLMLDAAIPSDTAIHVASRAHNDAEHLAIQPWTPEPSPYRRGNGTELPWSGGQAGLNTWELLFQRASGQYLQLQITLSGNERATPRLRALRAYYPRFSYLEHYVPAVYRDNAESASFLDRFLSNPEGMLTSIEDRIAAAQALLDVRSAPPEALEWLANWFGVALDPAWDDARRRLFLRHAAQFFEARGTEPGLMMALRLTLENCAGAGIFSQQTQPLGLRIVEGFKTRAMPLALLAAETNGAGLPVRLRTKLWSPDQGAQDLNRRYREALQLAEGAAYPISAPMDAPAQRAWRNFSMAAFGFEPSSPAPGDSQWPAFLRGRHGSIAALNAAYGTAYSSFDRVPFPAELPEKSKPLNDWFRFQGSLLMRKSAHQFTVFLPMPPGDAATVRAQRAKLDLAKRVIDLEKPAHTSYELKFYWAFFRIGEARLGEDSVLDSGSRSPKLLGAAELGDTYLGSGYLSRQRPGSPRERAFLKQRSC